MDPPPPSAPSDPPPRQTFNHPPYSEMIFAAITALKERDGSSRRAISKYIERVYSGLPPTHSALLTHHLKLLKNSGNLVMVKKSYMIPGSGPPILDNNNAAASLATSPSPIHPAAAATTTNFSASSQFPGSVVNRSAYTSAAGQKRGRGRPPKPKVTDNGGQPQFPAEQQPYVVGSQPIYSAQPISAFQSAAPPLGGLQQQLQQPLFGGDVVANMQNSIAQSVAPYQSITSQLAAMQQNAQIQHQPQPQPQQPVVGPDSSMQPVLVALGLAEDPNASMKRSRGRPKKIVGQSGQMGMVAKKGRGRPPGRPRKPKSLTAMMGANGIKKSPGRPKKLAAATPVSVVLPYAAVTGENTVVTSPRPRGRPRKGMVGNAAAGGVGMIPKRAGRPRKAGGVVTQRKSSGRPVGRPRKNANQSWTTELQSDTVAELKRKLEFFQSRVKEAVEVLKPQLTNEETAMRAILTLEGLAAMDVNMPLPLTEEPPQQQQEQTVQA